MLNFFAILGQEKLQSGVKTAFVNFNDQLQKQIITKALNGTCDAHRPT